MRNLFSFVIGTVVSASCCAADAQSARTYAVLSLVADKIFVVSPRMTTGSSLDRNVRNAYPTDDDSMEIVSVQAAEAAIKQSEPAAVVELYVTRDPKFYAALGSEDGSVRDLPTLLSQLQPVVADSKATHLLLIARHQNEARFRLANADVGVGKIYGVGFYVHEHYRLISSKTGEKLSGFVGPYAALKIQLIDLASKEAVKEWVSWASEVHAGALTAESAWKDMPAEKKVQALRRVIREAVGDGVAKIMQTP